MNDKEEVVPIRDIGDKVSVRHLSFFNEKLDRLTSAWTPHIEVDGEMLKIRDPNNPLGFITADTRHKARKIAIQVRDEMRKHLWERSQSDAQ
ncbi:hypothetical protein COLU111180_04215 [Cohnella lubricantis]|uniref:Uncharacterized protein n=1 Tax=Cohnella lubricantis TaxID=2163172 RepID=A0A841T8T2_9BACL|nr:hypothetical protein [Cohnella lubricantis]MBB6676489.1 hypothetical protein [Cohnella lubricantis]MBP2117106.1 hypothetical protein [Cohnella lubricantis]